MKKESLFYFLLTLSFDVSALDLSKNEAIAAGFLSGALTVSVVVAGIIGVVSMITGLRLIYARLSGDYETRNDRTKFEVYKK